MGSFRTALLAGLLLCPAIPSFAQRLSGGGDNNPGLTTNAPSLDQWRKMRFGMFIHWGPVTLRGTEIGWSRGREVPFDDYDRLYREFNPCLFDAAEWVRIAESAGMRYLVLVTKHHDGFALWDSGATEYDVASTPFRRDVVGEIASECSRQGLVFGTYYSILDWYHPDYPVLFDQKVLKEHPDMERYLSFMKTQLDELVTRYRTRILWFDGEWESPWTHAMASELYAWLRQKDDSLLINNRIDKGRAGMEGVSRSASFAGDFETPEQRIGTYETSTPWETCMTIATQWSWKPNDTVKSSSECIEILVRTAGGDGNLLLNVSPMPDGRIERRQVLILEEVGAWLKRYGETIYDTRGGPIPPQSWGVSTHRGNRVFLHVLAKGLSEINVPGLDPALRSAKLFEQGTRLALTRSGSDTRIRIPADVTTGPDLVVELATEP